MVARHNLACQELHAGNLDRAWRHWMVAAMAGDDGSLKEMKRGYAKGYVTKDDFAKALRGHQKSVDKMKSENRDKAVKVD